MAERETTPKAKLMGMPNKKAINKITINDKPTIRMSPI